MKQVLLKTWLILVCLLVLGGGRVWADSFQAKFGANNHNLITSSYTDATTNVVISTNETNTSASTYTGIGSDKTVSVVIPSDITVTKIQFEATSTTYPATGFTCNDNSTLTDGSNGETTWNGTATSKTLVFTNKGDKTARIKSITVTYILNSGGGDTGGGGSGSQDDNCITITAESISSFSNSYDTYDWTANAVSGKMYAYRGGSDGSYNMQFNKNSAIYNTTSVPGKIKSIKMTKVSGTDRAWSVYVSSSSLTSTTGGTNLNSTPQTVGTDGYTWNVTSGDYTYFYITKADGGTNIGEIVITYDDTPIGPAEISNLIKTSSADLYVGDEIADLNTYLNLPNDYVGTVTFSSTSKNVEIDGNYLLATGAGEATINVTAAANGNYLETAGTITLNISKKTPSIAWTNVTKASYTIFNVNDNKFTEPTAYLTTAGPAINYSVSGSEDDVTIDAESGELVWMNAGSYTVTAQTAETTEYNASNVLTYTINVVDPTITMTPASGTVSAENPTVTFTGNGVKIAYMDEDSNVDENVGATIFVDADETETYTVSITDDADNTFDQDFDVYFLQDAGLQFSANELRVVVGTTEVEEPVLSKTTDAAVTYELIYGDPEKGANVATIDPATGKLTLTGKSTETQGSVTVKATTPATAEYTAGEATYELVVYRNVPSFTWSAASVTIDQDELNLLPTPICERNVTSLTSSNTAVATIVDGAVTFVGYGTTTITGKTTATVDYAQVTASYELTFAPRYTVTFNVKGDETELREATTGAGVTAPEVADIADYTFAGWASTAVAEETTDAQTFATITAGKYMPTTNTTLYAVYQRVEESEGGSDDEGEFLIYANVSGTAHYMADKPTASGSKVNQITSTTTKASAKVFAISKNPDNSDQYAISYNEGGTTYYINCISEKSGNNTNYYLQSTSAAPYYFTRSNGTNGTYRLTSTFSGQIIAYRASTYNVFKMFKSTNVAEGSTEYYDLELEQISGGSTTYYTSAPVLEVAAINVSQFQNTTLCLSRAYTMPEGLVGKIVSAKEGSDGNYTLTLTTKYEEGDVVPAGEALVVQGNQGTYSALAAASSESKTEYPENLLVAEYTPQDSKFLTSYDSENSGNYYYYKLTTEGGANFGWYYGAEDGAPFLMSSKERAYLVIAKDIAQSIRAFRLEDLEESTTSIETIAASNDNETIFNLQGQRMNRIQKGVNIINGKKVIR